MLTLSRLMLNDRDPQVRLDLADCGRLHRRLMRAFPALDAPAAARAALGVLYRLESPEENPAGWTVLAQARAAPDWTHLPPGYLTRPPETKAVDGPYTAIAAGMTLRFRLRANPTKRVARAEDERWHGRRVALRGDEDLLAWLARKGAQHGFTLQATTPGGPVAEVRLTPQPDAAGRRAPVGPQPAARLVFGSALFDGLLRVDDAPRFQAALAEGIGSAKAFGFGLLSIAPAHAGRATPWRS